MKSRRPAPSGAKEKKGGEPKSKLETAERAAAAQAGYMQQAVQVPQIDPRSWCESSGSAKKKEGFFGPVSGNDRGARTVLRSDAPGCRSGKRSAGLNRRERRRSGWRREVIASLPARANACQFAARTPVRKSLSFAGGASARSDQVAARNRRPEGRLRPNRLLGLLLGVEHGRDHGLAPRPDGSGALRNHRLRARPRRRLEDGLLLGNLRGSGLGGLRDPSRTRRNARARQPRPTAVLLLRPTLHELGVGVVGAQGAGVQPIVVQRAVDRRAVAVVEVIVLLLLLLLLRCRNIIELLHGIGQRMVDFFLAHLQP